MERQNSILIVDDDAGLTSNLQDILEAEGYSTAVANDGQTALALHDKSVFDLILVDIRLPDMSGLDLTKKLAELSPTVEYIIITGFASLDGAIGAVRQRNIVGYLTKPLNMEYLMLLIEQVIERKQVENALFERNKELQCLHSIDMIGTRSELTLDEIYEEVVNLLPTAFQYPEITSARLTLHDKKFETKNYKNTDWRQSSVIKVNGIEAGEVQIVYLEEKPEGPFIKEERHLITSVADQLARITGAKQAEEQIKHLTLTLRSIRNVNQLITREKNREKLLQEACRILTDDGSYTFAWIALLDESGKLLAHAESGWDREFLPLLEQLKLGEIPTYGRQALEQASAVATYKLASMCAGCPLPDRLGSKVALTTRLEHAGKIYGLLSVSLLSSFVTEEERDLFKEAAGDIAFALHDIALSEEQKKLDDAILASEEKYLDLYTNAPTSYFSIGPNGFIKESNKTAQQWLGYSEDELRRIPVFDLYAEESKSKAKSVFDKRFEQGLNIENEEMAYQKKNGKKVYGLLSTSVIKDKDGQAVTSRSVVIDITERKKAEETLRESEQKHKVLLENLPQKIFYKGKNLTYVSCNDNYARGLGAKSDEIAGKTDYEFFPKELAEKYRADDKSVMDSGKTKEIEETYIQDGQEMWVQTVKIPIKNEEGNIVGIIGIFWDITERKQAQGNIVRSAQEWRTTFDSITDMVSIHDKDHRIIRLNKAFSNTFNKTPNELVGKFCYELVHGTDGPPAYCPLALTLKTGKPNSIEAFEPNLGIWIQVSCSPIFDEEGKVTSVVHITRNISGHKKMLGQVMAQDRLASIGQLVSGVAHEINNPLTSIIGFSELVLEREISDDIKNDLKTIHDEAVRTAVIVKSLLTFAREQPDGKAPLDINENIQKVLKLRAHEQTVNNIQVITHLASDLPQVIGNSSQFQQVVFNIIINAEYFMLEAHHKGTLSITTERIGDFVRASLTDDGPGISKKHISDIFSPFLTTKDVGKGTGLGLSVCYGIITEHGGMIYAESEPGEGATLVVELPIPAEGDESNEKS